MTQFKKSAVSTSVLGSIAYSSLLTVLGFAGQSTPVAASSGEVQSVELAQANCVSVVSEARSLPGQKARSSSNFNLGGSSRVISPPLFTFDIKKDIRNDTDPTLYKKLTNGSTLTQGFDLTQVYIANPKNAQDRFTIRFCPI